MPTLEQELRRERQEIDRIHRELEQINTHELPALEEFGTDLARRIDQLSNDLRNRRITRNQLRERSNALRQMINNHQRLTVQTNERKQRLLHQSAELISHYFATALNQLIQIDQALLREFDRQDRNQPT